MLLTQTEVAARLCCSLSKVAALRRNGLLKYLPGRPVLIDDADLNRYVEQSKCSGPLHDDRKEDTAGRAVARANVLADTRNLFGKKA